VAAWSAIADHHFACLVLALIGWGVWVGMMAGEQRGRVVRVASAGEEL
jgi:hypothetical protein